MSHFPSPSPSPSRSLFLFRLHPSPYPSLPQSPSSAVACFLGTVIRLSFCLLSLRLRPVLAHIRLRLPLCFIFWPPSRSSSPDSRLLPVFRLISPVSVPHLLSRVSCLISVSRLPPLISRRRLPSLVSHPCLLSPASSPASRLPSPVSCLPSLHLPVTDTSCSPSRPGPTCWPWSS